MAMRLERGRDFTDADGPDVPVVILSRSVAQQVWPGRDPLGQKLRIEGFLPNEGLRTVVGVVSEIRAQGAREKVSPAVYVPEAYSPISNRAVVIRANGARASLTQEVRTIMH